mgnify:CR=1 FL=1
MAGQSQRVLARRQHPLLQVQQGHRFAIDPHLDAVARQIEAGIARARGEPDVADGSIRRAIAEAREQEAAQAKLEAENATLKDLVDAQGKVQALLRQMSDESANKPHDS